jgi:hypothetical protein
MNGPFKTRKPDISTFKEGLTGVLLILDGKKEICDIGYKGG